VVCCAGPSAAQWVVIQANRAPCFAKTIGRYPLDQQWRLWLLVALLAMASGLSGACLRAHSQADRKPACSGAQRPGSPFALLAFLASWPRRPCGLSVPLQARWWLIHMPCCLPSAGRQAAGGRPPAATPAELVPLIWRCSILLGMALNQRPACRPGAGAVLRNGEALPAHVLMASFRDPSQVSALVVLMALGRRSEAAPAALAARWSTIGIRPGVPR